MPDSEPTRLALVTGISGQDGSYLVERLLAEGTQVHGLVKPEGDEGYESAGATLHFADLADAARLNAIIQEVEPTEIYNLGGISSVAQSWEFPGLTGDISGVAVAHVLHAAWRLQERTGRGVRMVQASSAEIFGAATEVPQTELTAIAPVSPYGAAKAYAHHLVAIYRSRGLGASSCILYNHESPRRPTSFVTRKITQAAARIAVGKQQRLAMGNLDARRDWGWAPDYVDAMIRAARHDQALDFVVATGEAHSIERFLELAMSAAGVDDWRDRIDIDPRFVRPVDAPEMVGDSTRARQLLGWTPSKSIEQIVEAMVDHDLELESAPLPGS